VQASLALAGEACTPAIGNALKNPLRWLSAAHRSCPSFLRVAWECSAGRAASRIRKTL